MVDLRVTTTTGARSMLEEAAVEGFRSSLRGEMLCPGDEGYDEARKVWNAMVDKKPAIIARCAGVADVINSVNFARTNDLLVSVRGGGHNIPGNSVCDGGIVIDTSPMKSVRVNPMGRTARAEPGLNWAELDHETQAFGLATTGGTVSDTGIAGLTLGGGIGWLAGKHGLSCDNLLSVDLVTADGRFLTVSATENEDLYWGVRGGGGNFGVVTSFEYQLHPVGQVLAGMVVHPFEKAKEVLKFYRDFSSTIPDEVNTVAGFLTSPEGDALVALIVCYNGPIEAGERALRPLREFGPPLLDDIRPMAYSEVQGLLDAGAPAGRQYYIKSLFMKDIDAEAIDTMIAHFAKVTSPLTAMMFQQLGNATNRVSPNETAFVHRDPRYEWVCLSSWLDPGESEVHIRWTRELAEAMHPFTTGGIYVNQVGTEAEDGADQIRAAYGAGYQRLVALKNKYDPTNLFSHNQNIKPTG